MTRFVFQKGQVVAGRLDSVIDRPVENGPDSGITLLRLEFGIHSIVEKTRELLPSGAIACRDIVVGTAIHHKSTQAIRKYAEAFQLGPDLYDPGQWHALRGRNLWVRIRFGQSRAPDYRNAFESVSRFDVSGYTVRPAPRAECPEWARVNQVATALNISESTVRREVDRLERQWGADLVRRTPGRQRLIFLPLLRHLHQGD